MMLAVDTPMFHNARAPTDVNHDGSTNALDAFMVIGALRQGGTRALTAPAVASSATASGGEGEGGSTMFVDVNGDNVLSPLDAFRVISRLRAEGQMGDQVRYRLDTSLGSAANAAQITSAALGSDIFLRVFVQDIRDVNQLPPGFQSDVNKGVQSAFLDVTYNFAQSLSLIGNDFQDVRIEGNPTGGTFTLTYEGQTTAPINRLATAADVEAALAALSTVGGTANVDVTPSGAPGGPWRVNFLMAEASTTSLLTANASGLTGGVNPSIVILPIVFGGEFSQDPRDHDGTVRPGGEIDEVGTVQLNFGFGGPFGAQEELVFSIPFRVSQLPLIANTDSGAGFAVPEGSMNNLLDVLANDSVSGPVIFQSNPADDPANLTVVNVGSQGQGGPGVGVVPDDEIDFGTFTLNVTGGTKTLFSVPNSTPNGTATIVNGRIQYSPNLNFNGTDTFTYVLSDGGAGRATGTVSVTVNAVNDAPVAINVNVSAMEDGPGVNGNFSATDVDNAPATLTFMLLSQPSEGSAVNNNDGTFTFNPGGGFQNLALNETRPVTFTYKATDPPGADSNTATVTATVTGVNDAPTANNFMAQVGNMSTSTLPFQADDVDSDDSRTTLTYVVTQPTDGNAATGDGSVVANNGAGTFTFNPGNDFASLQPGQFRDVTFTYQATDSHTETSPTGTVTVRVVPNQPPVAQNDNFATTEDATVAGNVLVNNGNGADSDPENDPIRVTAFDATSQQGATITGVIAVGATNGNFTYDPRNAPNTQRLAAGELLTDTFTYELTDSQGGTGIGTVSVALTGVNDAPVLTPSGARTLTAINEDPMANPGNTVASIVGATIADVDNGALPGIAVFNVDNTLGNWQYSTDGGTTFTNFGSPSASAARLLRSQDVIRFVPLAEFFGTATFQYRAWDQTSGAFGNTVAIGNTGGTNAFSTASDTATITINSVNDAPFAGDDDFQIFTSDVNRNLVVLTNDRPGPAGVPAPFNESGQTLSIKMVNGPTVTTFREGTNAPGTLTQKPDGSFDYTPAPDFAGVVTFTYSIEDNGVPALESNFATVTIDVVNFVPSTFSGFVYLDADNNGNKAANEQGIGGVEINLQGLDIFGRNVDVTTHTRRDGSYLFDKDQFGNPLAPSDNYILSQTQPAFVRDGIDTIVTPGVANPSDTLFGQFSIQSAGNDRFAADIGRLGDAHIVTNFGELGLEPQFISVFDLLASTPRTGVLVAIDNPTGSSATPNTLWYDFHAGWEGFRSVELTLNGNTATLTAIDNNGVTHIVNIPTQNNPNFVFQGQDGTRHLVRIYGSASDFGLTPSNNGASPEGEGEMAAYTQAVDSAFASGWQD